MYDNETKEKVWECFFKNQNLEVKEMLDVSKSTVYKWLREEGYNRDTKKILQTINNLWNSKEYDKALELVKLYQDIPIFKRYYELLEKKLFNKIRALISKKKWDLASELCSLAPENNIITSQYIKMLVLQDKLDEALDLCTEEKCNENINILSQKIAILTKLKRLEEAAKLCLTKQENLFLTSQYITILVIQGNLSKALDLCTEKSCCENPAILTQKIKILLNLQRKEEALSLCEQNKQIPRVLSLYQNLLQTNALENSEQKIIPTTIQRTCFEKTDMTEVIMMLAHLYHNSCTLSMIENSSLSTWEKIILKIGYYERNHSKQALIVLKKEILNHQFDEEQLKILKQSLERVKNHSAYFDIAYYNLLLCGKRLVAYPELEQEEVQVLPKPIIESPKEVHSAKKGKVSKKEKNYVTSSDVSKSFYTQGKSSVRAQNKKTQLKAKVLLLKDVYRERIYETQLKLYKYLYMEETKEQALRAWDYIEELKMKPVNKENEEKLIKLLIQ